MSKQLTLSNNLIRNRATSTAQDGWRLDIAYGDGLQREMITLSHNGVTKRTSYHVGRDCEMEVTAAGTRHIDAIRADGRVVALHGTTIYFLGIYYLQA